MEGYLDIKGKTLGRWKTKKFLIKTLEKTFELPRKKLSKKKHQRIICLQFYSLTLKKHKKEKKKRFRFILQAL